MVSPSFALADANSLIGTEFFRDHLIHIDYPARMMTLNPLPPAPTDALGLTDAVLDPAQKEWTAAYVSGALVLLPTLINKQEPLLFALDTGVWDNVYSPATTKALLSSSRDATLNLRGTSGDVIKVIPRTGGGSTDQADVHAADGTLLKVSRPVKLPVLRFALSVDTRPNWNLLRPEPL